MKSLESGHVLAERFEIVGLLGRGGTGTVYEALDHVKDDLVALKVVHSELAGDPQIRGRFLREAAILRLLEGPHVCPVLASGEDASGLLYLALPKIEGPSLALALREGPMEFARIYRIAEAILEALAVAHARGVVHRDLKPANVLLRHGREVFVVDFGMAKIVTGAGTGTTGLTAHNMVFGTPEYMAPEQARGDEADARTDIYALGVMLYEMATERLPYSGQTPLALLTEHLTGQLVPPRERAPERGIPRALEACILHAMAREPNLRYESVAVFRDAMRHAEQDPDDLDAVIPPRARAAEAPTQPDLGEARKVATRPPPPPSSKKAIERSSSIPVPVTPTKPLEAAGAVEKAWALVWAVVVLVSVVLGAWLALKK